MRIRFRLVSRTRHPPRVRVHRNPRPGRRVASPRHPSDYILIQFGANDGPGKGPLLEDVSRHPFSDYISQAHWGRIIKVKAAHLFER